MEPKIINNWTEQNRYFGLDYSSASAKVGEYAFDIRYDCDGVFDRREKRFRSDKQPNCHVCITITYKRRQFYSSFAKNIEEAKLICEKWLRSEIINYSKKYCVMLD